MRTLSQNSSPLVTQIIHIADLHIRIGDISNCRYNEYKTVFKNFCKEISELQSVKNKTALIMIAGDLFHNKGKYESFGVRLFGRFIKELLLIAPTLIIAGNHDFKQEDPSYADTIHGIIPFINDLNRPFRAHYLQYTDNYVWENIGIGMCSVKDTLKKYNTAGIIESLPSFPSPDNFPESVTRKVAFFHGSISQSALSSGILSNGYPLEWMKGYEFIVLGDNHKQQVNTTSWCIWGYPGSLVQQNFGENTFEHGYLLWNVDSKIVTRHHIYNPSGFITVFKHMSKYFLRVNCLEPIDLTEAVNFPNFPKSPKVRLVGCEEYREEVIRIFNHSKVQPSFIKAVNSIGKKEENSSNEEALSLFNGTINWLDYINSINPGLGIDNWVIDPKTILININNEIDPEINRKIKEYNSKIQKEIDNYDNTLQLNTSTLPTIKFKSLQWSYIMCFGEDNYIDFESMTKKLSLLNGRNASGKSSFLDVITIAIFGDTTSSREEFGCSTSAIKHIHHDKPERGGAYTSFIISINGVEHQIYRNFGKTSTGLSHINEASISILVSKEEENVFSEIASGATTVNQWVQSMFGNIKEFLLSTAICQVDSYSFFSLSSNEQKEIIDKAMNLNGLAVFQEIINEAIKGYKYVGEQYDTYIRGKESSETTINIEETEKKIVELSEEKVELEKTIKELSEERDKHLLIVGKEPIKEIEYEEALIGSNNELYNVSIDDNAFYEKTLKEVINNALFDFSGEIEDIGDEPEKSTYSKEFIESGLKNITIDRTVNIENIDKEKELLERLIKEPVAKPEELSSESNLDIETLYYNYKSALSKREKEPVKTRPISEIEINIEEFNKWSKKFEKEWLINPPIALEQSLKSNISELENRLETLMKQSISKPLFPEPKVKAVYKVDDTLFTPIIPYKDVQNLEEWKLKLKEWELIKPPRETLKTLKERVEKGKHDIETLGKLENSLNSYSTEIKHLEEIPFNHDCWACKKNNEKTIEQLNYYKQLLEKSRVEYNTLLPIVNKFTKQSTALLNKISTKEYYEENKEMMDNEKKLWKLSVSQWEEEKTRINKLTCYQWDCYNSFITNYKTINEELNSSKKELQLVSEFINSYKQFDISKLTNELNDAKVYKLWEEKDTTISKEIAVSQSELWIKWDYLINSLKASVSISEKTINSLNTYNDLSTQLEVYTKWNEWKAKNDNNLRVKLAKELNEKYTTYSGILKEINSNIYTIECKRVISSKKGDELDKTLQQVNDKLNSVTTELIKLTSIYDKALKSSSIINTYIKERNTIKLAHQKLLAFREAFIGNKLGNGFKSMIYKEKVLPILEKSLNSFISNFEEFKINISLERDKLFYQVLDRGNIVVLSHCSGYQKFLIGLAMRATLCRIGAVGNNVKHLIIDEGFSCCDSNNITKANDIIQTMITTGGYDSVIMMSHLDTIQELAELTINIQRDNGKFSYIRNGIKPNKIKRIKNKDIIVPETNTGKRGRPKKSET